MKLKYLELVDKAEIFPRDKEILSRYERANDYGDLKYKPKILSYNDLIAMHVNLVEKNHDPQVLSDFRALGAAIGGSRKIEGTINRNQHLILRNKKIVFVPPVDPSDTTLD